MAPLSVTGERSQTLCVPVHYEAYNSLSLRINRVLEFNESYVYQRGGR